MSEAAAREHLSAWQRWELASFDGACAAHAVRGAGSQRDAAAEHEAAALRARAESEGRLAGLAEGRAQAAAERQRLAGLLGTLAQSAGAHEQQLVDEVLDLALLVARQVIGTALEVRRELVLPVVAAALKQLPQSTQRVSLVLHPADVDLVTSFLHSDASAPDCRLVPDPSIAPGGCRVESDQCTVDATIPTRWRRVLDSLGRSDEWLERG